MAECDRNVAYAGETLDPRGGGGGQQAGEEDVTLTTEIDELVQPPLVGFSSPLPAMHARLPSQSRSRSPTAHLPSNTHFANFTALSQSGSPTASRSPSADPMSLSLQLGLAESVTSSGAASTVISRRNSYIDPFSSPSVADLSRSMLYSKGDLTTTTTASTNSQIVRLETELAALQSEVNFQTYLKQLHLAHMGTLHRAKVLDSGAEAERQSLVRCLLFRPFVRS